MNQSNTSLHFKEAHDGIIPDRVNEKTTVIMIKRLINPSLSQLHSETKSETPFKSLMVPSPLAKIAVENINQRSLEQNT